MKKLAEKVGGGPLIDAALLSGLFAIPVEDVAPLTRDLAITSLSGEEMDNN